jgi:hypothetical protein
VAVYEQIDFLTGLSIMRKVFASGLLGLLGVLIVGSLTGGCARPNEFGWTPGYTTGERGDMVARNWDMEGKMMQDDIDHLLLLRPMSQLTDWHVR